MPVLNALSSKRRKPTASTTWKMTEADFIEWSGDEVRAEWVRGEVIFMNAVSLDHADFTGFISVLIHSFVDEHDLGKVWGEPYQVRLPEQQTRRAPDVFFASTERLGLAEKTQFNGSPDLIVEVTSPDSKSRDRRVKFLEYQAAGVKEYWIVDPLSRSFQSYALGTDGLYTQISHMNDTVYSLVLPGLFFRPEWVWQLKLPKVAPLLKQMASNRKKLYSTRRRRSSDNQS